MIVRSYLNQCIDNKNLKPGCLYISKQVVLFIQNIPEMFHLFPIINIQDHVYLDLTIKQYRYNSAWTSI